MSLLDLPAELFNAIISFLGRDFFQRDVRRLTVCRRWYRLLWPLIVQNIILTSKSLVKFPQSEDYAAQIQPHITKVTLALRGPGDAGSAPGGVNEQVAQLNASLAHVATVLQRSPGLRDLYLTAQPERSAVGGHEQDGYLMARPVSELLSLSHLTRLEIDAAGAYPNTPIRAGDPAIHLCATINVLLIRSLREFRCRMSRVCERLLALPDDDYDCGDCHGSGSGSGSGNGESSANKDGNESSTALEELTISLTLSDVISSRYRSHRCAERCYRTPGRAPIPLKQSMEEQALAFASRMKRARVVRVVSHEMPSLDMFVFDAVSRRRTRLGKVSKWGAEGRHEDEDEEVCS